MVFAGAAYSAAHTQSAFEAAKGDYQQGATNYFLFALSDPVLSLPENTTNRLLLAFVANQGPFNHYQKLAEEGNNYQYVLGLVYGAQLVYSYLLGVQAEKAAGIANGPVSGWKFSATPSYQPMLIGGNGLGWNGEVRYDLRF